MFYFPVPSFHSRHTVKEAPWNYPPTKKSTGVRNLDLAVPPPPYISFEVSKIEKMVEKRKCDFPSKFLVKI